MFSCVVRSQDEGNQGDDHIFERDCIVDCIAKTVAGS
jgi:hypothetical protein